MRALALMPRGRTKQAASEEDRALDWLSSGMI